MQELNRLPLRELVAEKLRAAIESGALAPDARLREAQLAAELGASRTPLREALIQLVKERYVVTEPGRGFRVSRVTLEDGLQVERLVAALERLALEDSPPESDSELATLRRLQDQFRSATGIERREDRDRRWHERLTARSTNGRTLEYLEELRGHLRRYNRIYMKTPRSHERSVKAHDEILDALASGDRTRAGHLLESHWLGGVARAFEASRTAPQDAP